MIDGKNFFDQPVKYDLKTYENIRKIDTGPSDDYTAGCLLDSNYFKNYYEMMAIDLRKKQSLDADPRAIQQICFNQGEQRAMFFIIQKGKETTLDFSQGTVRVL